MANEQTETNDTDTDETESNGNGETPAKRKKGEIAEKDFRNHSGRPDDCEEYTNQPTEWTDAVRFTFANGAVRVVEFPKFPDNIRVCDEAHGASQKIGDNYADAAKKCLKESVPEELRGKPVEWAIAATDAIIETLQRGEWAKERVTVERPPTLVIDACVRLAEQTGVKGVTRAMLEAAYLGKDKKAARDELMKNAELKAVYMEIRAERARAEAQAAKSDTTSIFANLVPSA